MLFIIDREKESNNLLDYTFRSNRETMNVKNFVTYIYDLENTFQINFQIVTSLVPNAFENIGFDKLKKLNKILASINSKFNEKKNLKLKKLEMKSKNLISKQIFEEARRRTDENILLHKEQFEEFEENKEKKESLIKQNAKKFNEVEIFVRRESLNSQKFKHFSNYDIVFFVHENSQMQLDNLKSKEEIPKLEKELKELLKENVELKLRDEYIKDESKEFFQEMPKYKSLIICYNGKIKFLEANLKYLKSVLKGLKSRLGEKILAKTITKPTKNKFYSDCNFATLKTNSNFKIINNDNYNTFENNVQITLDINDYATNEIQSKQQFDQFYDTNKSNNILTTEFGNKEWDVSCIITEGNQIM